MLEWEAISQLHFLRPWALFFLPTIGLFLFWYRKRRSTDNEWRGVIAPHLYEALVQSDRSIAVFNPFTFVCALVILLCLVMAGPSWERQASPFSKDQAALVVVLDVSSSMEQVDVQPSRIARAKQKVQDLLSARLGSRTGLIVYSGSAHTVVPLTDDKEVLENFLGAVGASIMPRDGKFPEHSLTLVDKMLSDTELPGTVLLITDGASEASITQFESYFATSRHQLLILGMGRSLKQSESKAGASKVAEKSYLPLQEASLEILADSTRGVYQVVTNDDADVRRLNRRIRYHLKLMQSEEGTVPWKDAGYYLVWLIAALFLAWFRPGWTLKFGLALCVGASALSPTDARADGWLADIWLTPDQHGGWHFERGEYDLAAEEFLDGSWKGAAYYFAENFDAAATTFSQDDSVEGFFFTGNALAHARRYVDAVDAYNEVLLKQANHGGALKNRSIVQSLIDENNRLSDSQREEPGEYSKELGDTARSSDGAERVSLERSVQETLSAQQILSDEKINELWMREVQPDPSVFLATKFHMQLQERQRGDDDPNN